MNIKPPNIAICGPSGFGKSTSLRNLDPETTAILNTERKQLPFRGASKFKVVQIGTNHPADPSALARKNASALNIAQWTKAWAGARANKDIKTIVLESATSLIEMIKTYSECHFTNYDIWNNYNKMIFDVLMEAKSCDQTVIFISIEDTVYINDTAERRMYCQGGALKGKLEKEFEIVLWSNILRGEEGNQFVFQTISDGERPAKAPMEMFEDTFIPNDVQHVLETVHAYYAE